MILLQILSMLSLVIIAVALSVFVFGQAPVMIKLLKKIARQTAQSPVQPMASQEPAKVSGKTPHADDIDPETMALITAAVASTVRAPFIIRHVTPRAQDSNTDSWAKRGRYSHHGSHRLSRKG